MKHMLTTVLWALAWPVAAQSTGNVSAVQGKLLDERGRVNVWLLREDVRQVEAAEASEDTQHCYKEGSPDDPPLSRAAQAREAQAEKKCVQRTQQAVDDYQAQRQAFNAKWQGALLQAIRSGDEVAEVIWHQCTTTPAIDRSALASTCDADPKHRQEAARRLRNIGFEAAFDGEAEGTVPAWEPDQNRRRTQSQERILRQMEAGVFGSWTIEAYHGGNAPHSPEELFDMRRAAVLSAASILVRRSFTHVRLQGGNEHASHAQLRLNRKPLGTPTLAWSANVFHSGSPYTGPYDPAWDGFTAYLNYDRHREITVGGPRDAQYQRMLHHTLTRSEKRIDAWLQRDPRWAVFVLHRHGHHEWIPQGMDSPLGQLDPAWEGQWVLHQKFVDFKPVALPAAEAAAQLRIRVSQPPAIAQFAEVGTPGYACALRYSGASSPRPEGNRHATTATATALGYLPALSPAISPYDPGPTEAFAPLSPHKSYKQVLVQCPQGEWPDNRNKRFLFLANDTLVEMRKPQGSRSLEMLHWRRAAALDANAQFPPLPPPFDLTPVLARLDQAARAAEKAAVRPEPPRPRPPIPAR